MPDSYVSGMLTSTLEGLVQMKDVAKLRWNDVLTADEEAAVTAAVQEELGKLFEAPQVKRLVVPIVISDLGGDNGGYEIYNQLELHKEGLRVRTNSLARITKTKKVTPDAKLLRLYKVSVGDIHRIARLLGVQL